MTKDELFNIAKRLDEDTKRLIDKEVEERLEILKEGDLTQEELEQMEEYMYTSFILQEYLNGEYELLEEERQELFDEMEEMYNKYSYLLVCARLEEKVSKKKRMTLELMKIREQLMNSKTDYKNIKSKMKQNREDHNNLKELSKKEKMKELSGKLLEGVPGKQEGNQVIKELQKDINNLRVKQERMIDVRKYTTDPMKAFKNQDKVSGSGLELSNNNKSEVYEVSKNSSLGSAINSRGYK
jgi:hypothetical protein